MKKAAELNNRKVPIVRINPELEQYKDKIIFPEKLAKTNEMLKTTKLPDRKQSI